MMKTLVRAKEMATSDNLLHKYFHGCVELVTAWTSFIGRPWLHVTVYVVVDRLLKSQR